MRLKALGPHGGELLGYKSTCFLIDGKLSLDAGALTSTLPLEDLMRIDDILLTHSHFDHLKDLPMLADVLAGRRKKFITVHSHVECVKALQKNLFNDVLWPNFTSIPNPRKPVLKLKVFKLGTSIRIGPYKMTSVPVSHPVAACGFVLSRGTSTMAMSGDTGPTQKFWQLVNGLKRLKLLLIECSFPNELQPLADISGHLTPKTLEQELCKFNRRGCEVFLYHLKPAFVEQLKHEVRHLPVHILECDEEYNF